MSGSPRSPGGAAPTRRRFSSLAPGDGARRFRWSGLVLGSLVLGSLVSGLGASGCVSDELDAADDFTVSTQVDDWRDEILYQLMVDRFANGSPGNDFRVNPDPLTLTAYKGGDWLGMIQQLDYLEELGVTAVWISPIVLNVDTDAGVDGYHGYWAIDLQRLNPHFGDLATLRRLVDECHARGIKVVLDIVTNHLGQAFFYDINMNGSPDENVSGGFPTNPGDPSAPAGSPITHITEYDPDYDPRGVQALTSLGEAGPAPLRFFDMPEIFRIPPMPGVLDSEGRSLFLTRAAYNARGKVVDWNSREQVVYGDFPGGLKDLNTENQDVRDALFRLYSDWALRLDLDGFRIDTVKHVEHEFWLDFSRRVRDRLAAAGKRNFLLFGEAFDGDDALVGSYTRPGELDSVFYFPQKFRVFDQVFGGAGPTREIERLRAESDANYGTEPQPQGIGVAPRRALVNFIDNHDVPRFLWRQPDPRALRAALAYLLMEEGIPCIYYGTEQEFAGGNDPANREPLWWSGYDRSGPTFQWIARLSRIRRAYAPLRRGAMELRWTTDSVGDESDAGVLAFERTLDSGYVLVAINAQGAHSSRTALGPDTMLVGAAPGAELVDLLSEERFTVAADGTLDLPLDPYAVRILVPPAQRLAE